MRNTLQAGRRVTSVVDAAGVRYDYTIEIDTETGRIVQLERDEHGNFILDDDLNAKRQVVRATPPVIVTLEDSDSPRLPEAGSTGDVHVDAMNTVLSRLSREDVQLWGVMCWSSLSVLVSEISKQRVGYASVANDLPECLGERAERLSRDVAKAWTKEVIRITGSK